MVRDWDLNPDQSRGERLGFDETVFCAGKSAHQVRRILQGAADTGIPRLLRRLESDKVVRPVGGQSRQIMAPAALPCALFSLTLYHLIFSEYSAQTLPDCSTVASHDRESPPPLFDLGCP